MIIRKKKTRHVSVAGEAFKSVTLVLLILSTLVLTLVSWVYEPSMWDTGGFSWLKKAMIATGFVEKPSVVTIAPENWEYVPASMPITLALRSDTNGPLRVTLWNADELRSAFDNSMQKLLGEALEASTTAKGVSESDWLAALSSQMLYIEYPYPVPLNALGAWLTMKCDMPFTVSRLVLSKSAGGLILFFQTSGGTYYSCENVLPIELPAELNGSTVGEFAYSAYGSSALKDSFFAISTEVNRLPMLSYERIPDLRLFSLSLFQNLLFDVDTPFQQVEADGTILYVDGARTLRVSPEGRIRYQCPELESRLQLNLSDNPVADKIEIARLLADALSPALKDAQWVFESIREDAEKGTVIRFSSIAGGIRLYGRNAPFAEIVIKNDYISEALFFITRLSILQETSLLLPLKQTITLSSSNRINIKLGYSQQADTNFKANWLQFE